MTPQEYDVVVVGDGLAGLTASRDLQSLVLEASNRLPGRTWYRKFADRSFDDELGGAWIDPDEQPSIAAEVER